ncbi:MFS transporter, partial [Neobacillus vireti]
KDKKEKVNIQLDFISVLLTSVGFGGLLYGFSSAGKQGWDSPQVYLTIVIGAIALLMSILRQLKQDQPMLNYRIFKYPMFALSSVISMVLTMAMFSGMLLLPIYVQTIQGISPMDAGLMMLPGAIIMSLMSPITGKLFDKFGGRTLAIIGLSITVYTTYLFSQLSFDTSYMHLLLLFTLRMFGMSMVMMPVSTNGLNQLPARFYPHGTAMNNTLQQVSGAIGTALLVTIMSNRTESRAIELGESARSALTEQPTQAALAEMQQQIMMQAMLDGINFAFFVSTFIAALALFLAFFMKRVTQASDKMDENPVEKKVITKLAEN